MREGYALTYKNHFARLKTIKINMALNLEIIVGTYEEFLLGYRIRPSRSVSSLFYENI